MPRQQVGLKMDTALIERIDAVAARIHSSRTACVEVACEQWLVSMEGPDPEPDADHPEAAEEDEPEPPEQPPRFGVRCAWMCPTCNRRVFLRADETDRPRCDQHGPMAYQPNRLYQGKPTPARWDIPHVAKEQAAYEKAALRGKRKGPTRALP